MRLFVIPQCRLNKNGYCKFIIFIFFFTYYRLITLGHMVRPLYLIKHRRYFITTRLLTVQIIICFLDVALPEVSMEIVS